MSGTFIPAGPYAGEGGGGGPVAHNSTTNRNNSTAHTIGAIVNLAGRLSVPHYLGPDESLTLEAGVHIVYAALVGDGSQVHLPEVAPGTLISLVNNAASDSQLRVFDANDSELTAVAPGQSVTLGPTPDGWEYVSSYGLGGGLGGSPFSATITIPADGEEFVGDDYKLTPDNPSIGMWTANLYDLGLIGNPLGYDIVVRDTGSGVEYEDWRIFGPGLNGLICGSAPLGAELQVTITGTWGA